MVHSTETRYYRDFGIGNLTFVALTTQLSNRLDDVTCTAIIRLRQQSTVSIHW